MDNKKYIIINSSAFYRLSQMYFAKNMKAFGLGAGQQFFMGQIGRHSGITMAELAEMGTYDNGMVTRAVRRLEELGYVSVKTDETDRRIKHVYLTEKGKPIAVKLNALRKEWFCTATEGFTEEEINQFSDFMKRMADNAKNYHDRQKDICQKSMTDKFGREDY